MLGTYTLIFLIFGLACHSISNSTVDIDPTTFPNTTPTPYAERQKIINESGWPTPSPADFTLRSKIEKTIKSVDGRPIRVDSKYMAPTGESVYLAPPMPDGVSSRVQGELDQMGLSEFSVKGKVYLYELTVQPHFYKSSAPNSSNAINGLVFIFQIVDEDGDGKFETLFDRRSDVSVPHWASK